MTVTYPLSIKEQITAAIVNRLSTMKKDNPADSKPYQFEFGTVQREDLDPSNKGKEFSVAVFDQDETKNSDMWPVMRVTMPVTLEFLVLVGMSEDASTKMNMVFRETERRIMEDETFGSLATNVFFTRTEQSIGGRNDKYIEGAMFFEVWFRHHHKDPSVKI
jgi:uncharacterized protein YkuJ